MGMQREPEIDKGSEAYAKLLAQDEREWHAQYDALIARKIEIFNKLLQMHSAESYGLIEKLVDDAWTLFDLADNLEDLIAIVQQVKFLLWEIVFLQEKESEELLRSFVAQYDMQPELLRGLVRISCLEPEMVMDRLRKNMGLNL